MLRRAFWRVVTVDRSDLLDRLLAILRDRGTRFCVIGGQAVNAYAEPVVSLDLDLALAADELEPLLASLGPELTVERFPHSVNVSAPDSELRVQFQLDARYAVFVSRAQEHDVLGLRLRVAQIEDLLRGKIWAVEDSSRRASKRQKDLADIARLLEGQPTLRGSVPPAVLDRLL